MNWIIRTAVATDVADLSELAERTFRDAFSDLNTAENMDAYCASAFSSAIQAAEIADSEIETIVVEVPDKLIAYAQVYLEPETPDCVSVVPSVELRRFYVEQSFHGTGLARKLMASVLRAAAGHGARAVWLGVWEQNPRAIRFYQRFGFSEVGNHPFVFGADPQRDLVMLRKLVQLPQ